MVKKSAKVHTAALQSSGSEPELIQPDLLFCTFQSSNLEFSISTYLCAAKTQS